MKVGPGSAIDSPEPVCHALWGLTAMANGDLIIKGDTARQNFTAEREATPRLHQAENTHAGRRTITPAAVR
jgi:hypothetical protein